MTAEQTLTDLACLRAFLASGDVGNLLPLADFADETGRPDFAETVRRVISGDVDAGAVRFFLKHGSAYGSENLGASWLLGAVHYADIETWFDGMDGVTEWEIDEDGRDEEEGVMFGCVVGIQCGNGDDETHRETESLWAIGLNGDPWDNPRDRDPYCRVVEAELKSQLRARLEGK